MAVTAYQSAILRLLAERRRKGGESYVAGGVALNQLLDAPRRSSDIDLFHDTESALAAAWAEDRILLERNGYHIRVLRESPSFVEAQVEQRGEGTLMQWARDSAFRFFPLLEDPIMGLALHPFDLATNKVLAMAGRLEPRDWVDILHCDRRLQPLGFLIWAACGKDPGFNPKSLLAIISRAHYSQLELDILDFEGSPPDARALGEHWHDCLDMARQIMNTLPPEEAGKCVVDLNERLFAGTLAALHEAKAAHAIHFHEGRIGGAWPSIRK